eukprot:m.57953 g.57953  ORF g.57953 m.57953 type:complete len:406 (+) comp22474_c0_seq1:285-1502(+)
MMEFQLAHQFPSLLPENLELSAYSGFITVNDQSYGLRVCKGRVPTPSSGSSSLSTVLSSSSTTALFDWENGGIECDPQLLKLLDGNEMLVKQRLQQSPTLISFLQEIKHLIENLHAASSDTLEETSPTYGDEPNPQIYTTVLAELDALGWDKVVNVDQHFKWVELRAVDIADREHVLRISIPSQYPAAAPMCVVDLPTEFVPRWSSISASMSSLLEQFRTVLQSHQQFWNQLKAFDDRAWILEPTNANYNDRSRRVVITTNTSAQITLDPNYPHGIPECRFLGPDHSVNPLRKRFNEGVHRWDETKLVIDNLEKAFGTKFLSKATVSDASMEFNMECGICWSYKLEGNIPDKVCDEKRCARAFHQSCLYEYVRGLPNVRQSFGKFFGECPFCNTPINVKLTKLPD